MGHYDHSKSSSKNNSLSRRDFLRATTAVGVGATAALSGGLFLFPKPASAAPQKGGHFIAGIAGGATTDSLDPGTYSDNFMQCVGHSIHNYLTEVTNTGELIGELATDWDVSSDARTWTFKLRQGVTFHNGKPVEAEDVVASFNHHRGSESTSGAKVIVDPIKTIRAPDKQTVVITLSNPNVDFAYLTSDYHLPVMPSKEGQVDPNSGVGCGAYQLEQFKPGVKVHVVRNSDYWKPNRGWFDEVTFLVIKDGTARQSALMTGRIHAMNRVDVNTAHLLERQPKLDILAVAGGQHYTAPMLTTQAPFSDNNIRMALKYAVDRQQILDKILRGYGALGNDQPIASSYRYYAELPQREFDPDKAKHYLKKAGVDSLSVNLNTSDAAFPGATDAAVLMQSEAKRAGIDINVIQQPADGYWSSVWMKKPWCMSYWGGKPTEDWMFSMGYAANSSWNDTNWHNERFNKLLLQARAEFDQDKRADMYAEMQRLVRDEGGTLLPVFANYLDGIQANVGHDDLASNWDLDGLRLAERWWFKDA